MKFLVFGDVVGRVGRSAMTKILPQLRKEYKPDSVIINVENMARGKGITRNTMNEALTWKADVYTTGDHAWDNDGELDVLDDLSIPVIRPANYPAKTPGRGWHVFTNGAWQVAVINLQGQVFFRNHPRSPFEALDEILQKPDVAAAHIKLVDFHAEVTSEKRAFGWHADGRVSAMWGTHTHVPTADAQILPKGTGYISDLGMCGGHNTIIGMKPDGPMRMFLTQTKSKFEPPEEGSAEIGAMFIDIDPSSGKTTHIEHVRRIVENV
ncbi:MAG: YmdB family metallophosphoesterase [Candidatus Andersenbacteria bacterium]|nr:YmdB family metallophosphoesterase [Candidatus Andersenbacteria bacterium]MBI3250733.1 YmdB family metallophosphoesterase [Candidatus Andersenbacteria bacterium]